MDYKMVLTLLASVFLMSCAKHPNPEPGHSFRFKLNRMVANERTYSISYEFIDGPIHYNPDNTSYHLGEMVVENRDTSVLKLFRHQLLGALLSSPSDEVIAKVQADTSSVKTVLDWHNALLDAYEYRLEIPPEQTVRFPLHLDVRYAPTEVIGRVIGKDQKMTVDIYPLNFSPNAVALKRDRLPYNKKLSSLIMMLPEASKKVAEAE